MEDFKQRFEIIYKKFADWGIQNGFKPSKLAFSRFLGISQGRMQCWEKGQLPLGPDLKRLHDKLGFAYDWLIAGEGEIMDTAAEKMTELERLKAEKTLAADRRADVEALGKAVGQE